MNHRPRFGDLADEDGQTLGGLRASETNVSTGDGNALVAVDENALRHLLVPVAHTFDAPRDRGVAVTIDVRTLTDSGTDRRFVDITCLEPSLNDLFDIVVDEMLAELAARPDRNGHRSCQYVLDRWRHLLRRSDSRVLGPEQLAGLLGELVWLERLARLSPDAALDLWTGPTGAPQDFTSHDRVLEVKATRSGTITINGIGQLSDPHERLVRLAVLRLAPLGPEAIGVPDLIDRIVDADVDPVAFLDRLAAVGYHPEHRSHYTEQRWTVVKEAIFDVTDDFPRITPLTATYGSHAAVSGVFYSLDLTYLPDPAVVEPLEIAGEFFS